MELRPIASGVGLMAGRIGNSFPTIEKFFPLPVEAPIKFSKPFYPRYTDTLFVRAIYELAGRPFGITDLMKTASYHRLDRIKVEMILQEEIKKSFIILEPQFKEYPEVIECFIQSASRYISPFPEFEVDMGYGEADLYHNKVLVEMKSYSVMTSQDLIHTRNQVLLYACLAKYTSKLDKVIEKIEVINALTGQVWTWDFTEFNESGEADRFYWTVIFPIIANNNIIDEEIHGIRNLYEQNVFGLELLPRIIWDKYSKLVFSLQRKLKEKEKQLQTELKARRTIVRRQKGFSTTRNRETVCEIDYAYIQQLFSS